MQICLDAGDIWVNQENEKTFTLYIQESTGVGATVFLRRRALEQLVERVMELTSIEGRTECQKQ